ncbi:MAG: Lrp/AsnC family transcriptional regulator [Synechococcales cyanobacterium]
MNFENHSANTETLSLDELDMRIVQLLHKDGRMAYTEIAKVLGSAEATIRYRVNRLVENGAISIQAYLNPDKLGYRHMAMIGLRFADMTLAEAVAQQMRSLDTVSYVAFTAGRYDMIVEVTFDDYAGLLKFLMQLRSKPGITVAESHVVLKLLKSQYSFQIRHPPSP